MLQINIRVFTKFHAFFKRDLCLKDLLMMGTQFGVFRQRYSSKQSCTLAIDVYGECVFVFGEVTVAWVPAPETRLVHSCFLPALIFPTAGTAEESTCVSNRKPGASTGCWNNGPQAALIPLPFNLRRHRESKIFCPLVNKVSWDSTSFLRKTLLGHNLFYKVLTAMKSPL